jgi:hypothetical protein
MPPSTEQQRLVSMLDYLEEWDKLERVPVFDVATHQGGFLAWQHDLAGLPGIHFDLADASGEIWMEIERLRPTKPPVPPAALVPWVLLKDQASAEPGYRESLPNPEIPEKPLVFEEIPRLVSAFETYAKGPWQKWAETEKPRRTSIGIYDKLFNLLQTVETEGAAVQWLLASFRCPCPPARSFAPRRANHRGTFSIWNARVKDRLEDRLHAPAISGKLDLQTTPWSFILFL